MSGPANLLTEWAGLFMHSLAAAGIRDLVISPGSRSTPFVLAAAATPGLRLWDVIDERTAGFFALGQGRVTGVPSALLCTSGTAGAHYLPAVIEASAAGVPLIALTADRPFELQDCAAPQTIDQRDLFGDHVRHRFELGLPDASAGALHGLRRIAHQAVLATRWPVAGAVHVNLRARKPLEPQPGDGDAPDARALTGLVRRIAASPGRGYVPSLQADPQGTAALTAACRTAERGLIVCGPAARDAGGATTTAVHALAERTGFPLLVEATSQLRFPSRRQPHEALVIGAFDAVLRTAAGRTDLRPDLVIHVGAPATSAALDRLLGADAMAATPRFVIARTGWPDPHGTASIVLGEPATIAREIVEAIGPATAAAPPRVRWRARWRHADDVAWREIGALLDSSGFSEGLVVRTVVADLADDQLLMIGNSLPVRALDLFVPPGLARCEVLAQRGASGIDGLVAGAAGAASTGRATTLVIGDVSFLHDLGGLATARALPAPLTIVVINNDGGRIFEQLPIASGPAASSIAHFTTPHGLHLGAAAALWGHAYHRVETAAGLRAALASARAQRGCAIIEAVVPPGGAARLGAAIDRRLEQALASAGSP